MTNTLAKAAMTIIAIVTICAASCKKNDSISEDRVTGTWNVTEMNIVIKLAGQGAADEEKMKFERGECLLQIREDHTMEMNVTNEMQEGMELTDFSGKWELKGNVMRMYIDDDPPMDMKISKLTDTEMHLTSKDSKIYEAPVSMDISMKMSR